MKVNDGAVRDGAKSASTAPVSTATLSNQPSATEAPKHSSIKPGDLESILKKAPVLPAGVAVTRAVRRCDCKEHTVFISCTH